MDARSEDELAAMLAQEIGRVYTHHSASTVTLRLDKLMHVKTLGDRADVIDKFQRLLNIPETEASQLNSDDQQEDELLADKVGLYAIIRAAMRLMRSPRFLTASITMADTPATASPISST